MLHVLSKACIVNLGGEEEDPDIQKSIDDLTHMRSSALIFLFLLLLVVFFFQQTLLLITFWICLVLKPVQEVLKRKTFFSLFLFSLVAFPRFFVVFFCSQHFQSFFFHSNVFIVDAWIYIYIFTIDIYWKKKLSCHWRLFLKVFKVL